MAKLKIYEYENCSTCKKALKFLDKKSVNYERVAIVDQPPTITELKRMLEFVGGDLKRLFNTSGQVYREQKISDRLKTMTPAEALKLLSANGKLVKRPFVLGTDFGWVGFDEKLWSRELS